MSRLGLTETILLKLIGQTSFKTVSSISTHMHLPNSKHVYFLHTTTKAANIYTRTIIHVSYLFYLSIGVTQYLRQDQAFTLGLGYDYYSVMHYGPTQCAAMPNQPAMFFPQGVNVAMVGRADRLTPTDIAHIIRRYCPSG